MADTIHYYLVSWKNVLQPGALYAAEVLPWSTNQINELETEQNKFGKVILSIPYSSANVSVQALLGLKEITHLILEARIRMVQKLCSAKDQTILNEVWKYIKYNQHSIYWQRLSQLLKTTGFRQELSEINLSLISKHFEKKSRIKLIEMKSMQWTTIPRIWWKKKKFVVDKEWSRVYVQFLTQNSGIGNRTDRFSKYSEITDNGRVMLCPLCSNGPNLEIHMILKCRKLKQVRKKYKLMEGISLQKFINNKHGKSEDGILRDFFGGLKEPIAFYMDRGLCLMFLRREFFEQWTNICGEPVECSLNS